jgi:hypothetical protein
MHLAVCILLPSCLLILHGRPDVQAEALQLTAISSRKSGRLVVADSALVQLRQLLQQGTTAAAFSLPSTSSAAGVGTGGGGRRVQVQGLGGAASGCSLHSNWVARCARLDVPWALESIKVQWAMVGMAAGGEPCTCIIADGEDPYACVHTYIHTFIRMWCWRSICIYYQYGWWLRV